MWMKKTEPAATTRDDLVAAIVMPLLGHTDDQVIEFLCDQNAEVDRLSQGFLSVKATRQTLKNVEAIARVELKIAKQMH